MLTNRVLYNSCLESRYVARDDFHHSEKKKIWHDLLVLYCYIMALRDIALRYKSKYKDCCLVSGVSDRAQDAATRAMDAQTKAEEAAKKVENIVQQLPEDQRRTDQIATDIEEANSDIRRADKQGMYCDLL